MTVGAEGWPVLKHSPIRAGLSVCLRPGGAAGDGIAGSCALGKG